MYNSFFVNQNDGFISIILKKYFVEEFNFIHKQFTNPELENLPNISWFFVQLKNFFI